MPKIFLNTNIALYAFTDDPRLDLAEALLARGAEMSVQVLSEFTTVAHRELGLEVGFASHPCACPDDPFCGPRYARWLAGRGPLADHILLCVGGGGAIR
ncbi:PIN domain-containing protein [Sphingomonadales bacterium 56]|uniref:hypothetical protein n=1 Tax=unclassified Sphingobium TaxID=2611147 RepID=UPI001917DE81|nr:MULTISPECIES: hypothetical protein [unclassified Sphingobium]MBY2930505.1 PIN domain-containing protein [Sphingomonadales bacterium 56]MBY2960696.1 PIN domain-containing protein [Sphingomonadales bacterium 58]CAD7341443.1 hypothetical protein SPHS6_03553 [Sphingobium sp. S6]CAD7341772.1 hypothetical protein SPHS8_03676 [Sphingobium sp. S8]